MMSTPKRVAGDSSARRPSTCGRRRCRPELLPGGGRDWSCLPGPALHLIMKALLPHPADVFSVGSVCKAWNSVFTTCKGALLPSMPPLHISCDLQSLSAVTDGGRCLPWGGLAGRRPWVTPRVLSASHGYLFVAEAAERPVRQLFLMEAMAAGARAGEEARLISLPRIPFDADHLDLLVTAPPASPQCVVVVLSNEAKRMLCCRVGDEKWTCHDVRPDYDPDNRAAAELLASEKSLLVTSGGKVYGVTQDERLLVVHSFLPVLMVSVLNVKGFPIGGLDPYVMGCMVESGGDVLYVYDEALLDRYDDYYQYTDEKYCGDHVRFAAFRLDVRAREWVAADGLVAGGPRALLLNHAGQSLSWDAAGSGDEGCVYAWCPESDEMDVYHMKHGFVGHRAMPVTGPCFLPSACYDP